MQVKKIDVKPINEIEQIENVAIKRNETKLDQIKTRTNDLLSISSISFVLRVYQTKNIILQLIWIIFILGSFAFSVYYFITNIKNYLAFNVNTSIDQLFEKQPEFPSVSICSNEINNDNFDINILNLEFNENPLDWTDYFEFFKDSYYGYCYRFNSGVNMFNQSTKILRASFARIGLNLQFYYETISDFGELVVLIQNQSMPDSTLFGNGNSISSGCFYYYSVERNFVKKLPQPYNNCYKDVSLFSFNKTIINYILNKNISYTHNKCIDLCLSLKYNETNNCGCKLDTLDEFWTKCFSSKNTELSDCTYGFAMDFASANQYELCSEYCPLECESFTYKISQTIQPIIVSGNLSSDFLYPQFKTADNFSKNFFSIRVYYENLKYTLISESPQMELFGLISSIGGTFSLFLGLSFICLIDVLHIIWEIIIILFTNKQ